jgi:hypothetical protein
MPCLGRNGGSAASGSLPGSTFGSLPGGIGQPATTMFSAPGDRTFESISLQRRVSLSRDFIFMSQEPRITCRLPASSKPGPA